MKTPKNIKYVKHRKRVVVSITPKWGKIAYGVCGLMATSSALLTAQQIEAARKTITRKLKRVGKLYIRIFPDIPVTSKPAEVRMGKGKGAVDHWIARVDAGKVLFELSGVVISRAMEALQLASNKLPVQVRLIHRGVEVKNGWFFNTY